MNTNDNLKRAVLLNADSDWQHQLASLAHAFGPTKVLGQVKVKPQDFKVFEFLDIQPSGEGEHYWLDVSKTCQNTDQVAKALARFADVAYRDVGYSGLKDFYAETRQWFSVWRPKGELLDWSEFRMENVQIHSSHKHTRKIKRGTHKSNRFEIVVRNIESEDGTEFVNLLEERLTKIAARGVPNYFGQQRFGRNARNMNQAFNMLVNKKRIKDSKLRGLLLSSARSWLFNSVLSARVSEGSWEHLQANEPANLNGSNSTFIGGEDNQSGEISKRLRDLDIHPTAPLWGEHSDRFMAQSEALHNWESSILKPYERLCAGLEGARLAYQRRALRIVVQNLQWQHIQNQLSLSFSLPAGQFATSVLREIIVSQLVPTTNTP